MLISWILKHSKEERKQNAIVLSEQVDNTLNSKVAEDPKEMKILKLSTKNREDNKVANKSLY